MTPRRTIPLKRQWPGDLGRTWGVSLPEETIATRIRLLDEAARDSSLVLAYHVADIGYVERHSDSYRLLVTQQ